MPVLPYLNYFPQVAEEVFVAPTAFVVGRVTIGPGSSIWFGCTVRGDTGSIVIGEGVNIQDGSTVHTQTGFETIIGNRVSLGHHALVHAAIVEDDVLIGINASVLTGAKVGRGSIIAAHALVPEGKEVPPRSLVVGVPGKVVREITEAEFARIRRTAENYQRLSREYRQSIG